MFNNHIWYLVVHLFLAMLSEYLLGQILNSDLLLLTEYLSCYWALVPPLTGINWQYVRVCERARERGGGGGGKKKGKMCVKCGRCWLVTWDNSGFFLPRRHGSQWQKQVTHRSWGNMLVCPFMYVAYIYMLHTYGTHDSAQDRCLKQR